MSPVTSVPLWARGVVDDIKQAPETFSSWDSCMAKAYCKWPVIVGIVIGSLIILSVVACVINCMCCGIQCCKGCCGCLSCCCPTPRHRPERTKYTDDRAYHQPPPPPPGNFYRPPPAPPVYQGPQVARFDTPSSSGPPRSSAPHVNEDALPEMPSWNNAPTRRVEDTSPHPDDMEMEPLNPAQNRMPSPAQATHNPATSYANYRGHGDQNLYHARSPTAASPSPAPHSPYEVAQPYRDHSYPNPYPSQTVAPPNPYPSHHSYNAMPMTTSSPSESSRYAPYERQQSPYQRQPSQGSMQPPPSYVSHPNPPYRGMSPTMPTSPPPFSSAPSPHSPSGPGRPPSLLQSGRRPVPNSYRDV